jgi:radical SAM-linked protein
MSFQRVLFRFSKEGEARFLSHHDLIRLFERALRRAELPMRMTQGFNPHPRVAILTALPLGVEAADEPVEVEFDPPVPAAVAAEKLAAQLPRGIRLAGAQELPDGVRARVDSVAYEAQLPQGAADGPANVERILASQSVVIDRTTPSGHRPMDIRPAIREMAVVQGRLSFVLRVAPEGTPKPSEILAAVLGQPARGLAGVRMRRTRVGLAFSSPRPGRPSAPRGAAEDPLNAT